LGQALLLQTRGELAAALRRYEKARKVASSAWDMEATAAADGAIGSCYLTLGNLEQAIRHQKRALRFMKQRRLWAGAAAIEDFLGLAYVDLGELEAAEAAHRRALKLRAKAGDEMVLASTQRQLASVLRRQGKLVEAAAILEEVRRRRIESGDLVGQAMANVELARCRLAQGEADEAEILLAEAETLVEDIGASEILAHARRERMLVLGARGDHAAACAMGRLAVASLPGLVSGHGDVEGASARQEWTELFSAGARHAAAAEDLDSLLYFLESGRAGGMLEWMTDRDALRAALLSPDLRRAAAMASASVRAHEAALLRATRRGDLEEKERIRGELDAARRRLVTVAERTQREKKALAGASYVEVREPKRVRTALRPDEALVLYDLAEPGALALVVTPSGMRPVQLGPAEGLRRATQAFLHSPSDASAARKLRELLFTPLELEDGIVRLFLSPDRELSYLPFALLVPDRQIVLVPSGTVLSALAERNTDRGRGVLAVGDPDYGERDLAPLEESGEEAKRVGSVVLLRKEATETGFVKALGARKRWRAVHLAVHGRIDPDHPQLSAMLLARGERDDGQLTALDVLRLEVPADLVVLSGCETGRGKLYRSEGIIGLTRAFLASGAPTVLVSLWKVDDEPTRALMTRFYALWNPEKGEGVPASEALRLAQSHVRSQDGWRDPKHWAGWVLWGLGRPRVETEVR
jgi:tetratricopeptide (TPR) repeat protein